MRRIVVLRKGLGYEKDSDHITVIYFRDSVAGL